MQERKNVVKCYSREPVGRISSSLICERAMMPISTRSVNIQKNGASVTNDLFYPLAAYLSRNPRE